MVAILYSTLSTRKREISLLRITGASPLNIGFLMLIEAFLIAFMSIIIAVIARYLIGLSLFPVLDNKYGVFIELNFLSYKDLLFLSLVLFTSIVVSIFPSRQAFKNSINDGM